MPRNYKRKTQRGDTSIEQYERAYVEINEGRLSLRAAALAFNIDKMTLYRYKNKKEKKENANENNTVNPEQEVKMGYSKHRQILDDAMEKELNEYITTSSKIYYGLTPKNVKELAYEFALANKVKVPDTWLNLKCATSEWFTKFLKRHPNLSMREPEPTSLSRATSFNKHNVSAFFSNLRTVLEKHKFQSKDIWNVDETGVQTVQRPSKIVAEKGARQVGKTTSAERGQTVTLAAAVSAIGNFVPPLFIFPRVFYKDHFVQGGPPGCIGTAHPSGWMTGSSFLVFMKHFHSHVKSSAEQPCLLLLDNHESHLSIDVLNFCKENGIVMLSFPPHTSHRLQPLDRSVYGPFKKFYFSSVDNWLASNPGKTVTIYDIPSLVKTAFPKAMTPNNIVAGFKTTGIMPFNPDVFQDADYLPSFVTDRSDVHNTSSVDTNPQPEPSTSTEAQSLDGNPTFDASTPSTSRGAIVKPEIIRPLPKAGERKKSGKGKQPLKSAILTDTPIKNKIEQDTRERELKKSIKKEKAKVKLFKLLSSEVKGTKTSSKEGKQNMATREKGDNNAEKDEQASSKGLSKEKYNKQSKNKKKSLISKRRPQKEDETDSDGDGEAFCLVCLKAYSSSNPGQDWIQCISCKNWAHVECGEDSNLYTCINCQSDICLSSDSD